MTIGPAVADSDWLEPPDLYLSRGASVEIDRPLFQGDVFAGIPILKLPTTPPADPTALLELEPNPQLAMLVPHPCQCYNGDNVRPYLTVAPVNPVENYESFGEDRTGAKDKYALPDLPFQDEHGVWHQGTHVADFGRLVSVPKKYFRLSSRVSCLSHQGLGLLSKRLALFQLRHPLELAEAMAFTAAEWNESYLMQAWVRKHGKLKGFTKFMRNEILLPGVGSGPVRPSDVRVGALDRLLEAITGEAVQEPDSS